MCGFALRAASLPDCPATEYGSEWIRSSVIDISMGGCSFLCDRAVEPGRAMSLDIRFPGRDRPFRVAGPVLRCEHHAGLDTYKLVIQFLDMERVQYKEFCAVMDSWLSARV